MNVLALLLLLAGGALAGWLLRRNGKALAFNRIATRTAIAALLAVMGFRLARSRELFAKDPAVLAWAVGSAALLVVVFFLAQLAFGLLRRGPRPPRETEAGPAGGFHELLAVSLNVAWIALGCLLYALLPARAAAALPVEELADLVLRLLAVVIGFDLGAELERLHLRELPPGVLLMPFVNILGSLACGALFALLRGIPLRQGLLLYAGLGWYSLSSVLIAQKGLVVFSVLAFIHNVFRELFAILTAPLAARISPYLPVHIGGATSMDVMLPFVQHHSGRTYTLVSFYSGMVCSLAVIPLVKLLLG
ncbi:MAG TPA: lysine exporter LysO family protein [Holophaga sp.]|nr:lysine exporter LysO family protein [Holophaga sp.]